MLYWSASSLKDFLKCYRLYHYRTEMKEAAVLSKDILLGNIVHETIEKCDNLEEAILLADRLWLEVSGANLLGVIAPPKNYHLLLEQFYNKIQPQLSPRRSSLIEHMFKIPYITNSRRYVTIVGKMDWVDDSVYDWKTKVTNPTPFELYDLQFVIYYWAFRNLFNKEPEGVYYGHLSSGKLLPITVNRAMTDNLEMLLDMATELVYNGVDGRNTGYHCGNCLYKGICYSEYLDEHADRGIY